MTADMLSNRLSTLIKNGVYMEKFCLKDIYSRLGDEESRFTFEKRLDYSLTGDMRRMVDQLNRGKPYYAALHNPKKRPFLFGAGTVGRLTVEAFPDVAWQGFIDNDADKVGNADILPIVSFAEFMKDTKNAIVFISSTLYALEMENQLTANGFLQESIIKNGIEYFDLPYFVPEKNEFFIDAGGWDGNTTKDFFCWLLKKGGESGKSIIFEPNPVQYMVCEDNIKKWDYQNVEVVKKGLWHQNETIRFWKCEMGSRISNDGEEIIEAVSLDEYLKEEKERVTFIKMDVEGAELSAINGAEKTIKEHRHKLAICIYHKPEDIWEIPKRLIEIVPDYVFYIRHYYFSQLDTILYALPSREQERLI